MQIIFTYKVCMQGFGSTYMALDDKIGKTILLKHEYYTKFEFLHLIIEVSCQ